MSKSIESLRRFPSKEEILFHDHIVDTYFRKTNRKKRLKIEKKKLASFLIIAFTAIAVVSALFYIFNFFNNRYVSFLKEKITNSSIVELVKNGTRNNEAIKRLEFRGYAKSRSKLSLDTMVLNNPKKYNWADAAIDFRFPIDFTDKTIFLSLKGKIGGERVGLVIRDNLNRSARVCDIYLGRDWIEKTIQLDNVKRDVDLSQISHMRLECGRIGEEADKMDKPIDVTVYVKEIRIAKKGD
ncbi:MAG: hypothetical protein PHP46_00685 [Candidatus Omnitrophica bacterium]|nr:hypothetical protein [Candidatus Omnitrophota bacterium]